MPKRELPQVAIFQCYFSQTGNFSVKTFPLPFCNILLVVMIIHFYLFRNQTAVQLCNQSNTPKAHLSFVWKILIVKKYKINPLRITNMLSALCNKQNSNEAGRIFSKYIIKAVGKYETVVWHKCSASLFVKVFWEQLSDTLAKWIFFDRNMAWPPHLHQKHDSWDLSSPSSPISCGMQPSEFKMRPTQGHRGSFYL